MDDPIRIGGITPLTTIDFPGRLAAVIFCQGCPCRCRYCHNPHLQSFASRPPYESEGMSWPRFLEFLEDRRGFLDGVVFSGGEPTFQNDLPRAMKMVRGMGFEIGLHTAGPDPDRLEAALPWADWVGMDVKAPFDDRYEKVVGIPGSASKTLESLRRLLRSGVDYQLRTTVHSALSSKEDLAEINRALAAIGARATVVQPFRPEGCADGNLCSAALEINPQSPS